MPFVLAHVNVPVSREQETEIKTRMGPAIERISGKNENVRLFGIEANGHLYLRGNGTQKMAYIEASIFGNEDHEGVDAFAAAATDIFRQVLGIPAENIYIRSDDIWAWSVSGMFIDRSQYR